LKIYILYCGGCNPDIDRARMARELKRLTDSEEGLPVEYVTEQKDADVVLLLNGCPHACREEEWARNSGNTPFISVQGERFMLKPVFEKELPRVVLMYLKKVKDSR
jgi:hypothetical protein